MYIIAAHVPAIMAPGREPAIDGVWQIGFRV
jgi:hypothetical protein